MQSSLPRRHFLRSAAFASAGVALSLNSNAEEEASDKRFEISIAQWSLNRQLFSFLGKKRGGNVDVKVDPMKFAQYAKEEFGLHADSLFESWSTRSDAELFAILSTVRFDGSVEQS